MKTIKVQITTELFGYMGEFEVTDLDHVKQKWSHMSGVTIKVV